jgi:hypothetical protein
MAILRCRNLFFLLLLALAPLLFAQDAWHKVTMLGLNNAPLTKLRGIAIPAEAEYKGQKIKAYVFFSGYDGHAGGPGHLFLGIYVEDIDKYIPESEINKFMGPDLSQFAMQNDAIRLSVRRGDSKLETITRLLFTDGKYFDTGFQTDGFFETNPRKTKIATDAWMQFLTQMSDGFEDGKVVIGGKAFPSELTVRFSGNELGAKLKELMAYCNKQ